MKLTCAQLNPTVADLSGNLDKAQSAVRQASQHGSDLVIFSELYLTGYPPRDLLERRDFADKAERILGQLVDFSKTVPETGILMGSIAPTKRPAGHLLYNAAFLIENGKILFSQFKSLLPTYDVFDEARYFEPADKLKVFDYKGEKLGITICEDAWNDTELLPNRVYPIDPVEIFAQKGATLLINLSASPFFVGKESIRFKLMRRHNIRHKLPVILVNQVGGNDELIFDGNSFVINASGDVILNMPAFEESILTIDTREHTQPLSWVPLETMTSVFEALKLGIRDYLGKCGFKKAVLGLSGGIDSAVVCALAAESLGPSNVMGVAMPSIYSSDESLEDARRLAENLGIQFSVIPIERTRQALLKELAPHFDGMAEDTTEENIQARIRGNILMALSNKFRALTLSTGNKSEISVGYCTLYGDMSGGLSVISDVPKTMVYDLARYINRAETVIPERILTKSPSAELKPGQKDEDSLPPYNVLDQIIELYLDEGRSAEEIIDAGLPYETVRWVIRTIWQNEYKRRQAAPGLKITSKAFGMGRRMPVAVKIP